MLPALVGDVFASVPRVVGEEPGFQEGVYDERGRVEESRPPGVRWRLSCEGAIAFRLWTATPYPVEITDGHSFGERQAQKFTTARVAEIAGVSVGSLYQYFPNKEAILFRLQTDEWNQTSSLLENVLFDSNEPPPDRLRSMVRAFFQSEREEASLRTALGDAAPLYRDAPEAQKHKKIVTRQALTFMKEALPEVPAKERAFAAAVVMTTMSAIGKRVSGEARSKSEVDAWALAIGEMLCAYLQRLAERKKSQ